MGAAVIFVITIASFVTSVIYKFILANEHFIINGKPVDLAFLQTIVFILVIAALVQFVEMFLKKSMPSLYEALEMCIRDSRRALLKRCKNAEKSLIYRQSRFVGEERKEAPAFPEIRLAK